MTLDHNNIDAYVDKRPLRVQPLVTGRYSRYMVGDRARASAAVPADDDADGRPARELSADLYRVLAVLIVVIGHWLVSVVTYRDGGFGNDYPLAVLPWTRWLTLIFQVVPVFFLVGGYASAASWTRWTADGGRRSSDWVRERVGAILGPTTAYVALVLCVVAVLSSIGVGGSPLSFGGWAVAMHLWFVPVYLVVLALTPVAMAAHRRWGLVVPGVLAVAVAAVDAAVRVGHLPDIGSVNYVLCWAAVYQLGICWRGRALGGTRAVLLAVVAALVVAALLALRWYPISMVGAPGAGAQNNFPPNVALLAFATAQAGLLVAAAPAVTRRLRRSRWVRPLAAANRNVMALYLWQMVPVVIVALIGYPTGLLPQPATATGPWWVFRLVWLLILAAVTAVELALLWLARSVFDRSLPAVAAPLPGWCVPPLLAVGVGIVAYVLSRVAVDGFAPGGSFPALLAVLYLAGIGLLILLPRREAQR
jgi:surface polysaccharide O-acyltransferase-like enzyme